MGCGQKSDVVSGPPYPTFCVLFSAVGQVPHRSMFVDPDSPDCLQSYLLQKIVEPFGSIGVAFSAQIVPPIFQLETDFSSH